MSKNCLSREAAKQSENDLSQFERVEEVFERGNESISDKVDSFCKYASKQSVAKFLTKYEIFKKILNVNGSIVECGVLHGGGLMAWAKLSSIFEPVNHTRRIYGFDTFEGLASLSEKDTGTGKSKHFRNGAGMVGDAFEDIQAVIDLYDVNRPLSHIPKVEIVKGDVIETAPVFIEQHPYMVISLLYLDLTIYKPTKAALEAFMPRIVKGGIIAFDELNADMYPGETQAVHEVIGLNNLKIQRFPFDSYVSYARIE